MHHLINILVAGTLAATALALLDQRDQTQVEPRLVYEDSHGNKIDDPADEIGIPFGNRDPYYVYPSPPKVVDDLNQEESSDEFSIATPPFDKIKKKQKLLFFYDLKVNLSNWRISVSDFDLTKPPQIKVPNGVVDSRLYSLIMLAPKGPKPSTLLWFEPDVVKDNKDGQDMNILENEASKAYQAPNPPAGEDYVQYTFLLFEKPHGLGVTVPPQFAPWFGKDANKSEGFNFQEFTDYFHLGNPIAANKFFVRQ